MSVVATYDYTDERGVLLYQVVRYDPKDFRQRRPLSRVVGVMYTHEWEWSLGDVRRVLYRLPEVVEGVQSGRWIFLTEGEKDSDNMADAGFVATTACGGTSIKRYAELHGEQLRGAYLCILPDNDEPGRKKAAKIAKQLYGSAKGIKIVQLLATPKGGDATDWLTHIRKLAERGEAQPGLVEEMKFRLSCEDWYIPPPEPVIEKPKRRMTVGTFPYNRVCSIDERDRAHNTPIAEIAEVVRGLTRCPMPGHEDVHPSCTITNNLWWCPICDVGGDTIRFLEVTGKSFPDAVRALTGGV